MLSNLFQSPKTLLASNIAEYLASYFDVNASSIESNLVSDTKIILRSTKLKPLKPKDACLLVGDVDHVEFSWKWGGAADGSTSFIRETILTIQGAHFRLVPLPTKSTTTANGLDAVANDISSSSSYLGGYLTKHLDQILDHLTVQLKDVRLTIEADCSSSSAVVLETKSIQLVSLGRKEKNKQDQNSPALSQLISLASFQVYLTQCGDVGETTPFIDPISHSVSVERVSGKRFEGIDKGLELTGFENTDKLVLHLGPTQLKILRRISQSFQDLVLNTAKEREGNQNEDADEETNEDSLPTSLELPLPSIVLHLPNGSTLASPESVLKYVMDGSSFEVSGGHGIEVDGKSVLSPTNGAGWVLNLVTSSFVVAPTDERVSASIAEINLDRRTISNAVDGILEISEFGVSMMREESPEVDSSRHPSSVQSCTLLLQGNVDFVVTNDTGEWIKGTLEPTNFSLKGEDELRIVGLDVEGLTLGPASFGDAHIFIPAIRLDKEKEWLVAKGAAIIKIESQHFLQKTKGFLNDFMEVFAKSPNLTSGPSHSIPFSMEFPCAEAIHKPTSYCCTLTNFQVHCKDQSISIGSFGVSSSAGTQCHGVGALLSLEAMSVTVEKINAFALPDMLKLSRPLHDVQLHMESDAWTLRVNSALEFVVAENYFQEFDESTGSKESLQLTLPASSMNFSVSGGIDAEAQYSGRNLRLKTGSVSLSVREVGHGHLAAELKEGLDVVYHNDSRIVSASLLKSSLNLSLSSMAVQTFQSGGIRVQHGLSKFAIGRCSLERDSRRLQLHERTSVFVSSIADAESLKRALFIAPSSSQEANTLTLWECIKGSAIDSVAIAGINLNLLGEEGMIVDLTSLRFNIEGARREARLGAVALSFDQAVLSISDGTKIQTGSLVVEVDLFRTGFLSLTTKRVFEFKIHVQSEYIFAVVEPSTIVTASNLELDRAEISGMSIVDSSVGLYLACVPKFTYTKGESTVDIEGTVSAAVNSLDSLSRASQLFNLTVAQVDKRLKTFGMSGDGDIKRVHLPCFQISTDDPACSMHVLEISKDARVFKCKRIDGSGFGYSIELNQPVVDMSALSDSLEAPGPILMTFENATCSSTSLKKIEIGETVADVRIVGNWSKFNFTVLTKDARHEMVWIESTKVSGTCAPSASQISGLKVSVGQTVLSTGYSSIEWATLVEGDKQGSVRGTEWIFPGINIDPIFASLSLNGSILSTSANIKLSEFRGTNVCKFDDISDHYCSAATQRLPLLLVNAKVAGQSVAEAGAQVAAAALLSATPAGCVAGSLVGVTAVDGIRGILSTGKEARGAAAEEAYKFGDFSRGVMDSIKYGSYLGTSLRGGEDYEFGDLTSGASYSAREYGVRNKEKLETAGCSTAGMILGAAALGPIGLVAGAVAGGAVAARVLRKQETVAEPACISPNPAPSKHDLIGRDDPNRQNQPDQSLYQKNQSQDPIPHTYPDSTIQGEYGQQQSVTNHTGQNQQQSHRGNRFGDLTRSVVARGKQNRGATNQEGYKFGDFTRGLLGGRK